MPQIVQSKMILRVMAAVALGLPAGAAFAHAKLKSAQPGAGATVPSPHLLTLEFSEGVVAKLCTVSIRGAGGKPVATGLPVNSDKKNMLSLPIAGTLKAGVYKVTWHAVSVDTHRSEGNFSFTVAP